MMDPRKSRRETPRQRYEREKYEAKRCPECEEKRCPPEMDLCPYCHPEVDKYGN